MKKRKYAAVSVAFVIVAGCHARRARYLVLPSAPHYLLESPDRQTRSFPDTTANFSDAYAGWVDLGPGMTLKVDRAYFEPVESRKIQDYIGLESVRFRCEPSGALRQIEYSPLPARPAAQPPVTFAISASQLAARYHRLLFQVVVDTKAGSAHAVLISGASRSMIATHYEGLVRGDGCAHAVKTGTHCAAIPEGAAASLTFEIVANGRLMAVLWGSTVAGVIGSKRPVRLSRTFRDRMVPVEFDAADPNALRLPLLPGDVLRF